MHSDVSYLVARGENRLERLQIAQSIWYIFPIVIRYKQVKIHKNSYMYMIASLFVSNCDAQPRYCKLRITSHCVEIVCARAKSRSQHLDHGMYIQIVFT
jgi:hypothetical protein